jgi:hypothetical protein
MIRTTQHRDWLVLALLATSASLASPAWATIGTGSTRVPLTDFLIELYNVTNNVYVPLIALACLAFGAANLLFGFMRFGPVVGRIFAVVGILGLGVTWFGQTIGATAAIGLIA